MQDMFGRKITYLRVSVTDRCDFRCTYCMSEEMTFLPREFILSTEEMDRICSAFIRKGVRKLRITGGEPLVRPGIARLVRMLADEGIADLALTTNGQRLPEMAEDLKHAGLRRVNVSLDSLEPETFRRITRGGDVRRVLRGIDAALRTGLAPVKINTVVLRPHNAREVTDLARFALEAGCQIRFLELMPIGCARGIFRDAFVPASEVRARLEGAFRLVPLPYEAGQTSRNFLASDRSGRRGIVGLISPRTRPFCTGCTRIRLTSTGCLISCLARGDGPSVRELLRSDSPAAARALGEMVTEALSRRTEQRPFDTLRPMPSVGG